ncbi:MAG: hypothetical protein IPP72_18790 [Chitinophagaceae bacterium]|nr:hypothetical protein [Chitinophagaceae bacterium]
MISFNNNKWLTFLTIALLVANIVTLSLLWTSKKNGAILPAPPEPVFEFVTKQLVLNGQQQATYKTLREEHQHLQRPIQDSIAKARNAFFDLLKDTAVSDSMVGLYNKRTLAFQLQMELINFKHFQQLRAICDSGQQRKFDEIIETVLRKIGGQRPGGRRPPPQGVERDRMLPPPDGADGPPNSPSP